MDVNMPVMDGLEATRRLRRDARFTRLPVIALTADVMSAQIKTCLEAGCDAHVAKPIDLRNLLSVMDRCLARTTAREADGGAGGVVVSLLPMREKVSAKPTDEGSPVSWTLGIEPSLDLAFDPHGPASWATLSRRRGEGYLG
jgi:DNA-binding response OmpR family regulator